MPPEEYLSTLEVFGMITFLVQNLARCGNSKYYVSIHIAFVMQDTPAGTLQRKKSLPDFKIQNLAGNITKA